MKTNIFTLDALSISEKVKMAFACRAPIDEVAKTRIIREGLGCKYDQLNRITEITWIDGTVTEGRHEHGEKVADRAHEK